MRITVKTKDLIQAMNAMRHIYQPEYKDPEVMASISIPCDLPPQREVKPRRLYDIRLKAWSDELIIEGANDGFLIRATLPIIDYDGDQVDLASAVIPFYPFTYKVTEYKRSDTMNMAFNCNNLILRDCHQFPIKPRLAFPTFADTQQVDGPWTQLAVAEVFEYAHNNDVLGLRKKHFDWFGIPELNGAPPNKETIIILGIIQWYFVSDDPILDIVEIMPYQAGLILRAPRLWVQTGVFIPV